MENLNNNKVSNVRKWYVIYTRSRWEKKVDQLLQIQGINSYCPLRKVQSKWADRIKNIELPLFSSYVFVHISPKEELKVRLTLGVMNFVYYMGKLAQIRPSVIDSIKEFLQIYPEAEVMSLQGMEVGDRVKIKEGIMKQKQGQVIKLQGKDVLVFIDSLNCALITKVPSSNLELIN
ncbi:transcriptional antiterminator RfaH [Pedobacter sp. CG_S7]|uniref:UpxY family transcription antiterminator n=1 Tax=Pedobacter sp. CG_S7 TaxID=3143930 RepID=UPI003397588F